MQYRFKLSDHIYTCIRIHIALDLLSMCVFFIRDQLKFKYVNICMYFFVCLIH